MKNENLMVLGKPAKDLRVKNFLDPADMTDWEYAAYDAYTEEACNRDGIETLQDLFGEDFGNAFHAWKACLNKTSEIVRLEAEKQDIEEKLTAARQELASLLSKA